MNHRTIRKTVGVVLCLEAVFFLAPLLLALHDRSFQTARAFLIAMAAVLIVGLPTALINKKSTALSPRDGAVTVALSWIVVSLFGALPFIFSGVLTSPMNAIFETVSGFSTTGATIIDNVEAAPRAILLWRSITNWIGGMGVLVFMLAIMPASRDGGSMFLLRAEFPGPTATKLVPKMRKSAMIMYALYIFLTLLQTALLMLGGLSLFDSVNIALCTVSTGGFSIKNNSMAAYGSYAQGVTAVFMLICSISFSIYYLILSHEAFRVKKNVELKLFALIIICYSLVIGILSAGSFASVGEDVHHTLFQVISVISTTCYVSVDASAWSPFVWSILILLMITGPMAGSTGGGMKLSRLMILCKSTYRALKQTINPDSVNLIRVDGEPIDEDTVLSVNSFAVAYLLALMLTSVVLSLDGLEFGKGIVVAISSIGNIGYGLDANTFTYAIAGLTPISKILLCFNMFLGRLEIFPLLILFAPATWRK